MNQLSVIYHLARADFLERVRQYSFLIILGAAMFLGYQVAVGNITVRLDEYRGEFNSAWIGSMMSLVASFFFGWFGFYLVKGSVARDRITGVGQIIATTPLTRLLYMFGKFASNFSILVSLTAILALAGIAMQFIAGENTQLDLPAMLAPYLLISLPLLAIVAALAVFFESIAFLSGGVGNLIYFFLFVMIFPLVDALSKAQPAFEPLGFGLYQQSMGAAAKAQFPEYGGSFVLGDPGLGIDGDPASYIFHWPGVDWTTEIILARLSLVGIAIAITVLASIFFDRFDSTRTRPRKASRQTPVALATEQAPSQINPPSASVHVTPLPKQAARFAFWRVLVTEIKLLLKGLPWWWYAIAGGLIIAGLVNTPQNVRSYVLPITWLWPVLVWSGMGNREQRHNVHQMVFSSAVPLWRQLPAAWLAGFCVTILTGAGAALRLLIAMDWAGLLAFGVAALFIPSLALALGIFSNSHKLFEIVYVSLWYFGPMNKFLALDYIGANTNDSTITYLVLAIVLVTAAFLLRARQIRQ